MSITRREVIQSAVLAALAVATPRSVFALQLTAKQRFLIFALKNGKHLAIDRLDERKAYVLTPSPADGEYALSKHGSLVAKNGVVQHLKGPAATNHYTLTEKAGAVTVQFTDDGKHVVDVPIKTS